MQLIMWLTKLALNTAGIQMQSDWNTCVLEKIQWGKSNYKSELWVEYYFRDLKEELSIFEAYGDNAFDFH